MIVAGLDEAAGAADHVIIAVMYMLVSSGIELVKSADPGWAYFVLNLLAFFRDLRKFPEGERGDVTC